MQLNSKNLKVFAAKHYTNDNCESIEEFEEDFKKFMLSNKMFTRIVNGRVSSIRLLCNHVITLTNNFEVDAVKRIMLFLCNEKEKESCKTVLNYLNFLSPLEWQEVKFCLQTAILLKEMDR